LKPFYYILTPYWSLLFCIDTIVKPFILLRKTNITVGIFRPGWPLSTSALTFDWNATMNIFVSEMHWILKKWYCIDPWNELVILYLPPINPIYCCCKKELPLPLITPPIYLLL
jgi:hypothetical protein